MLYLFLTIGAWIVFALSFLVVGGSIWADLNYSGSLEQRLDALRGKRKDYMIGTRSWFWMGIISFTWLLTYYIYFGKVAALLKAVLTYGGWVLGGTCVLGMVIWFSLQTYNYYRGMKK
jgi:hypothetical protein